MFGANAIWGVMSPIAKFVMISGTITPWVVTNLRIAGAMILIHRPCRDFLITLE